MHVCMYRAPRQAWAAHGSLAGGAGHGGWRTSARRLAKSRVKRFLRSSVSKSTSIHIYNIIYNISIIYIIIYIYIIWICIYTSI